jgi:hypothetical protein
MARTPEGQGQHGTTREGTDDGQLPSFIRRLLIGSGGILGASAKGAIGSGGCRHGRRDEHAYGACPPMGTWWLLGNTRLKAAKL